MKRCIFISLLFFLILSLHNNSWADDVTATVLFDSNTLTPPNNTNKMDYYSAPSYDGTNIGFRAWSDVRDEFNNAYFKKLGTNALAFVASEINPTSGHTIPTAVPSGQGFFTQFDVNFFSMHGGSLAFRGRAEDSDNNIPFQEGVYWDLGGSLSKVVDQNTVSPSNSLNFKNFGNPSVNSGVVAFWASTSGSTNSDGIYLSDSSTTSVVADHTSTLPGATMLPNNFGSAAMYRGNLVAFRAGASDNDNNALLDGIYTKNISTGDFAKIADTNTAIPGGTGNFTRFPFFAPIAATDGTNVAFRGCAGTQYACFFDSDTTQDGLYANIGTNSSLVKIMDINTQMPCAPANTKFNSVEGWAIYGTTVVFVGSGNIPTGGQYRGLFGYIGGRLGKIVGTDDSINGASVNSAVYNLIHEGLDGPNNKVAIQDPNSENRILLLDVQFNEETCVHASVCGNNDLEGDEECDDGNTSPGDGCRADCTIELCGDNILDPQEDCDDGNTNSGDGCRSNCTIEFCGDGIQDPNELCDDGNEDLGDGCRPDCTTETCGDGIVDPQEKCDDGNNNDNDGCSANCTAEDKDCAGTFNGTAVLDTKGRCCEPNELDQCEICKGDGQSCLGCESVNITSQQLALDNGAQKQARLAKKVLSRVLRNTSSRRTIRVIKKLIRRASKLQAENSSLIWTVPTVVTNCSNTSLCVQNDHSAIISQYDANAAELRKLTRRAVRILRNATGNRRVGQRFLKRAQKLLDSILTTSAIVPVTSSTCS